LKIHQSQSFERSTSIYLFSKDLNIFHFKVNETLQESKRKSTARLFSEWKTEIFKYEFAPPSRKTIHQHVGYSKAQQIRSMITIAVMLLYLSGYQIELSF